MAYDESKEKVIKKKEIDLEGGARAVVKVYSYNSGPKKIKILFIFKRQNGDDFTTAKFPGLENKSDILKIGKAFTELAKEL